mmetsp:Transcript_17527/g.43673  ORF Transcript_17527/g.43673 Transcript_17527/m.43673 type:complete len:213 (+) Transcript_17527:2-640(+)
MFPRTSPTCFRVSSASVCTRCSSAVHCFRFFTRSAASPRTAASSTFLAPRSRSRSSTAPFTLRRRASSSATSADKIFAWSRSISFFRASCRLRSSPISSWRRAASDSSCCLLAARSCSLLCWLSKAMSDSATAFEISRFWFSSRLISCFSSRPRACLRSFSSVCCVNCSFRDSTRPISLLASPVRYSTSWRATSALFSACATSAACSATLLF